MPSPRGTKAALIADQAAEDARKQPKDGGDNRPRPPTAEPACQIGDARQDEEDREDGNEAGTAERTCRTAPSSPTRAIGKPNRSSTVRFTD